MSEITCIHSFTVPRMIDYFPHIVLHCSKCQKTLTHYAVIRYAEAHRDNGGKLEDIINYVDINRDKPWLV